MKKKAQYFAKVEEYKERFSQLPTETLRTRLNGGSLIKEAAVALREVIEEREATSQTSTNPEAAT